MKLYLILYLMILILYFRCYFFYKLNQTNQVRLEKKIKRLVI